MKIYKNLLILVVIGCLSFIAVSLIFKKFNIFGFESQTISQIILQATIVALIIFVLRYFNLINKSKVSKRKFLK